MYYEVKNKISSTLVQLAVHFETKRTATQFEGLEKKRRIIRTVWVNSDSLSKITFFSSEKSVYFNQFICLLCIQAVSDLGTYQAI